MSGTVHHARLASSRTLARDVAEYAFALDPDDAALRWRAGQFISINVGTAGTVGDAGNVGTVGTAGSVGGLPDGTAILRSYSIASLPSAAGTFTLIVKLVAGGPASHFLRRLAVGERVRFTGPMGFFVLDLAHPGDVVLAATGTGIAPLVPMVEELLDRPGDGDGGRIHVFFGVREPSDLFWQDVLARLVEAGRGRVQVVVSLTQPPPSWTGARGRINPHLFALLPSLHRPTFYLCGNGAMIREVKAGLVERGVDRKRQIRTEAFFD